MYMGSIKSKLYPNVLTILASRKVFPLRQEWLPSQLYSVLCSKHPTYVAVLGRKSIVSQSVIKRQYVQGGLGLDTVFKTLLTLLHVLEMLY